MGHLRKSISWNPAQNADSHPCTRPPSWGTRGNMGHDFRLLYSKSVLLFVCVVGFIITVITCRFLNNRLINDISITYKTSLCLIRRFRGGRGSSCPLCSLVFPRVGVGMLRGKGFLGFLIPWFLGFLFSRFLNFLVY